MRVYVFVSACMRAFTLALVRRGVRAEEAVGHLETAAAVARSRMLSLEGALRVKEREIERLTRLSEAAKVCGVYVLAQLCARVCVHACVFVCVCVLGERIEGGAHSWMG